MSRSYSKRVELIVHIWIHDLSERPKLLDAKGKPEGWGRLKEILERMVGMDRICLLLTGWEDVRLEEGIEDEVRVRGVMKDDVKNGLMFGHLSMRDRDAAWSALEEVIELSRVGLDGNQRDIEKRIEMNNASDDDIRVRVLQQEMDILCSELDESPRGRQLRQEIQSYFANFEAQAVSHLTQMDDAHEVGRKKKEAEATIDHEYLLFRKTMWSFFEAIEKLKVPIGRHLQDFYGFNVYPPPKKSFFKRYFR
ncbi:hypothetical protein AN958_02341 [Leucoagaricus sp. SymC.cos]|nr:hypothetical protein AN958_02341 [Leucoagaricus sp. SymC.cos]